MPYGAAGEFIIRVADGGHPIWVELQRFGETIVQFNALELRDLGHAVKQARREARHVARRMDPDRAKDY